MRNILKLLSICFILSMASFAQETNETKKDTEKTSEKKEVSETIPSKQENITSETKETPVCPEPKPLPIFDYRSVGIQGHGGFFRVESAQILPLNPQGFYGSYNAKFMNQKSLISDGTSSMRLDHIFSLTYVPLIFSEFAVATSATSNLEDNNAELIQQMGNLTLSSKTGYSFFKAFYFATTGKLEMKTRVGDLNIRDRIFNYTAKGEITFDLVQRFNKPFRFHGNMGFHFDGTPEDLTALNMNELFYTDTLFYDQLQYAGGLEWLFKNMILGCEYSGEYPLNAGFPFIHTPQRISGGIKIFPYDNSSLAINIGGEIGIFKRRDVLPVPDITFLAGMSFIFSPSRTLTKTLIVHHYPEKKSSATLRGVIKDRWNDKAIEDCLIVVKGERKGVLSEKDGRFILDDLPFKKRTIVISKQGYISKEFDISIDEEEKILSKEFLLEKQPPPKMLPSSKVKDTKKELPQKEKKADEVLEEKNEDSNTEISIEQEGNKIITSQKIYFETGKMDITINSLQVLDKIVEYLKKHQEMKLIQVEGYADNTGSKERNILVSNERAKKVREYLIAQGVAAQKLRYKGYGSEQPIALNDTETDRMKNRRVELRIIKTQK